MSEIKYVAFSINAVTYNVLWTEVVSEIKYVALYTHAMDRSFV